MIKRLFIVLFVIAIPVLAYLVYARYFSAEAKAKNEAKKKLDEQKNKALAAFGKDEAALEYWTRLNIDPINRQFVTSLSKIELEKALASDDFKGEGVFLVLDRTLRPLMITRNISLKEPKGTGRDTSLFSKIRGAIFRDKAFFDKVIIGAGITGTDANLNAK